MRIKGNLVCKQCCNVEKSLDKDPISYENKIKYFTILFILNDAAIF